MTSPSPTLAPKVPDHHTTPEPTRRDSVAPNPAPTTPQDKKMKITDILNPVVARSHGESRVYTPTTTAYTAFALTPDSTPQPGTPTTHSPPRRAKLIKDAAVFVKGTPQGQVNYPPYEIASVPQGLSQTEAEELTAQYERFEIFPYGQDGLIRQYPRHIPYSSEKKRFFGKTGRKAFEVFQYIFKVPGDPTEYKVMWDYQVGLVRITPFFKACQHTKTTPAKALSANPGLKDLAHSITGGALAAQGYWIPYACARAICVTFCYDIRWALTPVFGPRFIRDCLPPNHPGWQRWKIDGKLVQEAREETEGWRSQASRSATPESPTAMGGMTSDIPRSTPFTSEPASAPTSARARRERPTFMTGSPFARRYDADYEDHNDEEVDSPDLSPKTSPTERTPQGSAWTSINNRDHRCGPLPSSPRITPSAPPSLRAPNLRLLTEPGNQTSWRAHEEAAHPQSQHKTEAPRAASALRSQKRSARDIESDYEHDEDDNDEPYLPNAPPSSPSSPHSSSAFSTDSADIVKSPLVCPQSSHHIRQPAPKRVRRSRSGHDVIMSGTDDTGSGSNKKGKSTKVDAKQVRAAGWLMELALQDSKLAHGPSDEERVAGRRLSRTDRKGKRKVSEV